MKRMTVSMIYTWRKRRQGNLIVIMILVGLFCGSKGYANEIIYDRGERRDPFLPLVGPGGVVARAMSPDDLNIEGIIYDPPMGSLVLINGEFYRQGETVKNSVVISIFKDRVILRQEDDEKALWLREEVLNEGEKDLIEGEKEYEKESTGDAEKADQGQKTL